MDINTLIADYKKPPPIGAAPVLQSMIAMPSVQSSLPSLPSPALSAPIPPPVALSQSGQDQNRLNYLKQSGSGIDQIQNPLLRGIARAGDIAASVFAPRLTSFIPGTTLHHNMLVGQAQQQVQNDQAQAAGDATVANTQAEARIHAVQANQAEHPGIAPPEYDYVDGPNGKVAILKGTTTAARVTVNGDPLGAVEKPKSPEQTVFDAGIAAGKAPADALSDVYNAKNVKDATTAQMFANGYRKAHPNASDMDVATATIRATQTEPKITILNAGNANREQFRDSANAPTGQIGTSGDQYLSSLPAQRQQLVKSTAAGDIAIPPPGSRAPGAQQLRQDVLQYDPTYTDARYKGKQQFKTGGDADKLVSLTTTLSHAQSALDHSKALGFAPGLPFNASAEDSAYNKDAEFITGELGKLVEGKALTQGEHEKLISGINSTRQSVRDAAIQESLHLLGGKVQGIFQKYKAATGESLPSDKFLDPETNQRLQSLGVGGNAPSGKFSVTAPDGSVHPFDSQAQADKFKKLAGIQ